ncbi:phosphatidylserine decarboxylase family protein [Flagellimonas sp. HMM57]|uniref:phosphatidylserine decarboxylase family protein n=1 Tax=unclassified Flagellimonas TaxID=2644544 RepID=UPI0013D06E24|nr:MULTISPECIES: phosphatidylserine decarboxylase family protein [unclassified Flagellimonas]UII76652.1 phosphatidylserine decarboxylase family protein [Flagellimonas sp. HMM57]
MFHKEGQKIIIITFFIVVAIILAAHFFIPIEWIRLPLQIVALVLLILILQFFRNPKRYVTPNFDEVLAPVDGKVVVIEEVEEPEYFKGKRRQVSIFMSPVNVHVTRYAASGTITYSKYHPGKYLVAWHPKSSTENERTTVVIHTPKFGEIGYRQIAGALARRIVNYAEEGEQVAQGEDAGFIKFGSRVDLLLPLDCDITVKLGQKVVGAKTCIAAIRSKDD